MKTPSDLQHSERQHCSVTRTVHGKHDGQELGRNSQIVRLRTKMSELQSAMNTIDQNSKYYGCKRWCVGLKVCVCVCMPATAGMQLVCMIICVCLSVIAWLSYLCLHVRTHLCVWMHVHLHGRAHEYACTCHANIMHWFAKVSLHIHIYIYILYINRPDALS